MELTEQQKAMLAAAASLAEAVGTTANPAIGAGVTAVVAILNGVLTQGKDYTIEDFNAAVDMDNIVAAQELAAEEAAAAKPAAG